MDKQSIVFALYKNNQLIGYRLDTFGTLGLKNPKLYTYSKEQVDIVLKNIEYNIKEEGGIGKILGCEELTKAEKQIHKTIKNQNIFEVRVLKAPNKIYEKEFDVNKGEWITDIWGQYPVEEIEKWLMYPDQHEVIETHWFGTQGKINFN